jgi:hypothetical protein
MAIPGYQVNPGATSGSGLFGSVPGPISLPQPLQNVSAAFPGTAGATAGTSADILQELSGKLSPDTLASIQNQGAAFGIQIGMPGSGLEQNYDLNAAAQASMGLQKQGASNYNSTVSPESRYLTVAPSTAAELAMVNATNAAAPNPTAAGLTNIGSYIGGLGFTYALNNMNGGGSGGYGNSPDSVSYASYSQPGSGFDSAAGATDSFANP